MTTAQYHIVFICSRLDLPGGIERAGVNTANLFAAKGHRVTILIADTTPEIFYPLHPAVRFTQVALHFGMNASQSWLRRKFSFVTDIFRLRRMLQHLSADIVIATEYPFAVALVLTGLRKKLKSLSWEHFHFYELKKSWFWQKLIRFSYPKLDAIACLNNDEKKLYSQLNHRCIVIPNFITAEVLPATTAKRKRLLTVAHLSASKKGFDMFPAIAMQVLNAHPDWEWKVIGKGEMLDQLHQFINENNLEGRLIIQEPISADLSQEYNSASVFVLTSRYECFPMTLLEAMQHGLPCVAFDCETGPRAVIRPGLNGLLVEKENADAMARALISLLNNSQEIERMGRAAEQAVKKFSAEKVYLNWESLFRLLSISGPNDQSARVDTATR